MHLLDTNRPRLARPSILLRFIGVPLGFAGALLILKDPLYFAAALIAITVTFCFFTQFEKTIIALLIIRSALDSFGGLSALFAIGLDLLILVHIALLFLTRQKIYIDPFWLIFAVWVLIQGLWPVLTALGGLGLGPEYLSDSIREWVRIFSWLLVYLAVNQCRGRLRPEQVATALLFSLGIPLFVATLQLLLPSHVLPSFFQAASDSVFESGSRISSTLGHPNTFVSFLIFSIGLTYWKMRQTKRPLLWGGLLLVEIFFLVSTKALVGLPMLVVLLAILTIPELNIGRLLGAIFLFSLLIILFVSSEFGRDKIASVLDTPLLNPDLTVNRAILLSWFDTNSFNWRLTQWNFLLEEWRKVPILGYGLGLARYLGPFQAYAHNDYVRLLAEGGILGTFFFIVFQVAQLIYLGRVYFFSLNSSQRQLCLVLIAILGSALLGMATENIWTHTAFFFYYWTLFSLIGWDWPDDQPLLAPSSIKPSRQLGSHQDTGYL